MTDAINWNEIIDAARAQNSAGIQMRGQKKYTPVSIRMEIARRFLGGGIGVSTEIVTWGQEKGSPVVVKATITRIPDGAVLATGHAEEIRGAGNVNQTSALENAETSAIGRALAALGLSGGEFASANELDAVERKRAAKAAAETAHDPETGEVHDNGAAIRDAWEDGIRDSLPANATPRQFHEAAAARLREELSAYKTVNGLNGAWSKYGKILARMNGAAPDLFASLQAHYEACERALTEKPVLTVAAGRAICVAIGQCDTLADLEEYMNLLSKGPSAFAVDHPKIKAAYDEHRAALIEANPGQRG